MSLIVEQEECDLSAFQLNNDISKKGSPHSISKLSRINGLAGRFHASDFQKIDQVSTFLWAVLNLLCENKAGAYTSKVIVIYAELLLNSSRKLVDPVWTDDELRELRKTFWHSKEDAIPCLESIKLHSWKRRRSAWSATLYESFGRMAVLNVFAWVFSKALNKAPEHFTRSLHSGKAVRSKNNIKKSKISWPQKGRRHWGDVTLSTRMALKRRQLVSRAARSNHPTRSPTFLFPSEKMVQEPCACCSKDLCSKKMSSFHLLDIQDFVCVFADEIRISKVAAQYAEPLL